MSRSEEHALAMIERVRAKPLRFRDERITMAHGAGGKATQALVEGLLAPALGVVALERGLFVLPVLDVPVWVRALDMFGEEYEVSAFACVFWASACLAI